MPTNADRFRALHRTDPPFLLPNAWDFASAAALADAGFAAIGTTSLGVAAAHGLPDAHGLARAETIALTHRLGRLGCPVTVDIEAGFGRDPGRPAPGEVVDLVAELTDAGAAGINLEDGRPDGSLAAIDAQVELIAAVKAAVPDVFLNARTDTHWLTGDRPPRLADARRRVEAYVAAGADGVFVPGLTEEAEIGALTAAVPVPVNILYAPGRHTVGRLAELGVRRVSCGSLLFRAALAATVRTAFAISRDEPVPTAVPSYTDIQRLLTG